MIAYLYEILTFKNADLPQVFFDYVFN